MTIDPFEARQDLLQGFMDRMSQKWQESRSVTQMTLGQLIDRLKTFKPDDVLVGFGELKSYRGYYCDLAFEPVEQITTASELLNRCQVAMGRIFEGYKGGDYLMGERTPLWFAAWGKASGQRLLGLNWEDGSGIIYPVLVGEEYS